MFFNTGPTKHNQLLYKVIFAIRDQSIASNNYKVYTVLENDQTTMITVGHSVMYGNT